MSPFKNTMPENLLSKIKGFLRARKEYCDSFCVGETNRKIQVIEFNIALRPLYPVVCNL